MALAVAAGISAGCASHRPAPLVVQTPVEAPCANNATESLNLKLVTYNIWGLPSWLTGAPRGRYVQIARELERLDPDVILLQEAWTAKARKAAPHDGRWLIARGVGQHFFFQQNGLVTLSRFPITGGAFYPFSHAAFPDNLVRKGVLKVTLQLPDRQVLNVWNVHLQDGGPPRVRQSQIDELIARVNEANDGQIADVVGGDFNCTPESTSVRQLEAALGPSIQKLAGAKPFVTWDGLSSKPGGGQTLDYLFVRSRVRLENMEVASQVAFYAQKPRERLSDHFGIEAFVSVSPGPDVATLPDSISRGIALGQAVFKRTSFAVATKP